MEKQCSNCKQIKPITDFYFRKETGKYRDNCKKCKSLISKKDIAEKANAETKVCKHCGLEKKSYEYQKAGKGKWLQPYCKPCDAIRKQKHRQGNLEKLKLKSKEYYLQNKDIISIKSKQYCLNNKEKIKERGRIYRLKNSEIVKQKNREYVKLNKEEISQKSKLRRQLNKDYYRQKDKILRLKRTEEQKEAKRKYDREYKQKNKEKLKEWRLKNADKIREQKRIWSNKKAATDISYRIKRNLRTRIRCALKPNNAYKVDTSENLLGCSIDYFKSYIESLFTDGMNWEKFMSAEIEIDHIKPCAKFDLTKEDEQRKCFHYTNCQPLWWQDNNKKGANYKE